MNRVGQNRKTNEKHDEDCVKEGFQLARVKYGKDDERGREDIGMLNRSVNISDRSELELAWSIEAVRIWKTIFQYFYHMVFRIHRFLRCAMFYIE